MPDRTCQCWLQSNLKKRWLKNSHFLTCLLTSVIVASFTIFLFTLCNYRRVLVFILYFLNKLYSDWFKIATMKLIVFFSVSKMEKKINYHQDNIIFRKFSGISTLLYASESFLHENINDLKVICVYVYSFGLISFLLVFKLPSKFIWYISVASFGKNTSIIT